MDCDICFLCHNHVDFAKLDEAYPHLSEATDTFPPQGLSQLEEYIFWGSICLECARAADAPPPEPPRFRTLATERQAGPGSYLPGNS